MPRTGLAVTWLGHATALIELDGVRMLTDPVLGSRVGPLVRIASPVAPGAIEELDAVLLSHLHADHADARSLRPLGTGIRIIAPAGAGRWLASRGFHNVEELRPGECSRVGGVGVRATPARHGHGRWPHGRSVPPIGLVASGSRSCYFAGDTDLFEEMASLAGGIDLALLPIAGWGPTLGPGHLDPARAAEATAVIAPRVVVPIHWGTLALTLPARLRSGSSRAPARLFAQLARRRTPAVEVRVLAPGETLRA